MVQHQIKMDFGKRELKYISNTGEKVIWPFTCHGVTSLQPRKVMVRLAKTRRLANSTSNVVHMRVDADDGTEGIFIPKPTHRRHMLLAPTVDTVKNEMVRISVMNVEGRREKLPAREALGTWIPVTEDMQLLKLNGELERERVAKWVKTLRKEDAEPLKDEDKLDIG